MVGGADGLTQGRPFIEGGSIYGLVAHIRSLREQGVDARFSVGASRGQSRSMKTALGRFSQWEHLPRRVRRISRTTKHVQTLGPHLNLETQVNSQPVTTGPLKDPHLGIDVSTIRPGDWC